MKIAFYKGKKRLFNKITSWYLRGEYSHVEIVLGELDNEALCLSSSFMDGGVRKKWIELDSSKWDFIEVQDLTREQVESWYKENNNKKYDLLGLGTFISRLFESNPNRRFCSSAIAEILGLEEHWRYDTVILYKILKWRYSN